MDILPAQAADLLRQIEQNEWKWLRVKRFAPENYANLEQRYAALEEHHREETSRMVDVIRSLCKAIVEANTPK